MNNAGGGGARNGGVDGTAAQQRPRVLWRSPTQSDAAAPPPAERGEIRRAAAPSPLRGQGRAGPLGSVIPRCVRREKKLLQENQEAKGERGDGRGSGGEVEAGSGEVEAGSRG